MPDCYNKIRIVINVRCDPVNSSPTGPLVRRTGKVALALPELCFHLVGVVLLLLLSSSCKSNLIQYIYKRIRLELACAPFESKHGETLIHDL